MPTHKYFADLADGSTVELNGRSIQHDKGKFFGTPVGFTPVWMGDHWDRGTVQASRVVRMKSSRPMHECDARCMGATGRTMQCECACGGKNHGRGFVAEAA